MENNKVGSVWGVAAGAATGLLAVAIFIYVGCKLYQGGGSWDIAADIIRPLYNETRQGSYQKELETPVIDAHMTWGDYQHEGKWLFSEPCGEWRNQKTGKTECLLGLPPVERIKEFLPQDEVYQKLYDTYIAQGKTIEESMELVLKAHLATQHPKQ